MAEVVIVGGGIAGLATALLLGRQGSDVVVCERDAGAVPAGADEMWDRWDRPGIPQARLGHTFLPGFRVLLAERAPDVLERLYAAGAPLVDFAADVPGGAARPGDGELAGIMCRRPVLEGILRQAVEAEPTVDVRAGCDVTGLVGERPAAKGDAPRVVGVRTRGRGSIAARTVVVAGGRLVPVRRWLAAIDALPVGEVSAGCGLVCFTRFFRIRPRASEDHRVSTELTVERDLGYMRYEIYGADSSTFCVELIPAASDHELRALRNEATHMAVARALPESHDWLDPERAMPIGPVAAMGQERDVLRAFVHDGRPVALGLHVIGDARCQTHSLYAWGSHLALAGAAAVADVVTEHRRDPEAQALALDARIGDEIAGRHALACARDRALQRVIRNEPEWDEGDAEHRFIHDVVVPASAEDPEIFRAVRRWELQLDPAAALASNTAVRERARNLWVGRSTATRTTAPTREAVLALIARSPA